MSTLPVLIIGSGIAGLSTARALRYRGIAVKVFEKEPKSSRQGYAVSLKHWATGPFVDDLSIEHARLIAASATDAAVGGGGVSDSSIMDVYTGQPLVRPTSGDKTPSDMDAYRANGNRLRDFLIQGLDVSFDSALTSVAYDEVNRKVTATFANRAPVEGCMLVAADGVLSTVRSVLLPTVQPIVTPAAVCTGLRQMRRKDFDAKLGPYMKGTNVATAVGHHCRFSLTVVDITEEKVDVFWSFFRASDGVDDALFRTNQNSFGIQHLRNVLNKEISRMQVLAAPYAEFFTLENMRSDEVFNWLMRTVTIPVEQLKPLAARGVVFIGDAAHATPAFASEGANHALLDGVELGRRIAEHPSDSRPAIHQFYDHVAARWTQAIDDAEKRLQAFTKPIEMWRAYGRSDLTIVDVDNVVSSRMGPKREPSSAGFREQPKTAVTIARLLRSDAAYNPQTREALIDDLAEVVLHSEQVRLAQEIQMTTNADMRFNLAIRLCEVIEPSEILAAPRSRGSDSPTRPE